MHPILFFDGDCGLCHFAVQWIAKRDKDQRIIFAPLQGETAKQLLPPNRPDSLILYEEGQLTYYGKAAAKAAMHLPYPAHFLGLLHYLPAFIIDPFYCFIASRRQIFGRTSCWLPTAIDTSRFFP